jgi:hypothetical protein
MDRISGMSPLGRQWFWRSWTSNPPMTQRDTGAAPKRRAKTDLPQKVCAACGRPFVWRKKWARDWDNVRFCSERCRRGKGRAQKGPAA